MPRVPPASSHASGFAVPVACCGILTVAAAVRLYHLGVPAMWWDELLVPLTAAHPVSYIFDFSRRCEMHPPLFHLFIKIVLAVGSSETALRLPEAAAGVTGVWLLFRLARPLAGNGAALFAAALYAWNPAMVALSRQVRPYAFFLLLFLATLVFARRFLATGGRRELASLALCNAALLFLHYAAVLLVPFQVLVLCAFWLARRGRDGIGRLTAYAGAALAAFAVVSPFFFSLMARGKSGFMDLAGPLAVLRRIGGILAGFLSPFESRLILGIACTLAALGLWTLWRRDRFAGALCTAIVVGPLSVLVAARDDYIMYWHIAFAAPVVALCAGAGISLALSRLAVPRAAAPALAVAVALCGAGWLVVVCAPGLYANDDDAPLSRNIALALSDDAPPSALWSMPDMGLYNGVAWYLDRFREPNPLRRQEYDAAQAGRSYFVAAAPDFFEMHGALTGRLDATRLPGCRVARGEIRPRGPFTARDGARLFAFTMEPENFYNQIDSLRGVTLTRGLTWQAVPTANDTASRFAYRFRNETGAAGPVFVSVERRNAGAGGMVSLSVAADGGPEQLLAAEPGPAAGERLMARFAPETVPRELTVAVGLFAGRDTAAYPGGNLELAAAQAVTVYFAEPGLLFDLMRPVTLPGGLRLAGIEGLERGEGHAWRWAIGPVATLIFPRDAAGPAVLRLRFSNPIPDQGIIVRVNGREAGGASGLPVARWMENEGTLDVPLALAAGQNRVELAFARHAANPADPGAAFPATDTRPLAMALTGCALYEADAQR
ncbi:MAG TPA: hypothetical protein DIU49_02660 [Desulfovibrio sp.]|nr:hypothetical protein [Desulfovibrio sp.]